MKKAIRFEIKTINDYSQDNDSNIFQLFSKILFSTDNVQSIFNSRSKKYSLLETLCGINEGVEIEIISKQVEDFRNLVADINNEEYFLSSSTKDKKMSAVVIFVQTHNSQLLSELDEIEKILSKDKIASSDLYFLSLFIDCHLGLMLFMSNSSKESEYNERLEQLIIEDLNWSPIYYRGHANSDYKLIPSIFRNLKFSDSTFNVDDLFNLYKDAGLIDKYNLIFPSNQFNLDYDFLAYVQHSCAYSPFLDFTSDIDVAKVFASHETNFNSFRFNNSAIFVFKPHSIEKLEPINQCIKKYQISYHSDKLNYSSLIFDKPLLFCTIKDFLPKYTFSNVTTNDRMKYQKGSFLFVYKAVIANGHICITYNMGFLVKLVIPASLRNKIYKNIVINRKQLEHRYLMDPYSFLSDSDNKL